jgi:hypothetical protein
MAIVGGPGRVHWPKKTLRPAHAHGFIPRDGDLVEIGKS